MKNILLLVTILVSSHAFATDLSGNWNGSGKALDSKGKPIVCESVVLTFVQTANSLNATSAFTCEGQPITVPAGAMELRGSELFDKGVKSGTLTDTNLDVVAKAKGYVMQSKAAFTDKDMNLRAVISIGNNPAPVLSFEAVLHR